jgi:hypothetical protein
MEIAVVALLVLVVAVVHGLMVASPVILGAWILGSMAESRMGAEAEAEIAHRRMMEEVTSRND